MNHDNELLPVLFCRKQQTDNELLNVSGKEQYAYLSNILNATAEKDMQLLQGTKIRKFNTLVDISLHLQNKKWIPDLNLGFTDLHYIADNEQICDAITNASMLLICREYLLLNYQSTTLPSTMSTYSPVNTIHIHHNGHGHFVTSSSLDL